MFRLHNNVPEVYVQKSRDFQLFCRLYDSAFSGVKYSTDSLQYTSETKNCNERLLQLLQTKLGFFTHVDLGEKELRYLLQAFPTIIRHKGSILGIYEILYLLQRISQDSTFAARIQHTPQDKFQIKIQFENTFQYPDLLQELMRYVVPAGVSLYYEIANLHDAETTAVSDDTVIVLKPGNKLTHVTNTDATRNSVIHSVGSAVTSNKKEQEIDE